MTSLNRQIFEIIKTIPHVDEGSIHASMRSSYSNYSLASGKSTIARLLRAKYIRKDINKRFVAHIDEYAPLPPYTPKKKKRKPKVTATIHREDSAMVAAAKLAQQISRAQAEVAYNAYNSPYRESAAMLSNQQYHKNTATRLLASDNVTKAEAKGFFAKLRALFT